MTEKAGICPPLLRESKILSHTERNRMQNRLHLDLHEDVLAQRAQMLYNKMESKLA